MSCDQLYNVDRELCECLKHVYEILDDLEDIITALEDGRSITNILFPPFDPLKTIGKY